MYVIHTQMQTMISPPHTHTHTETKKQSLMEISVVWCCCMQRMQFCINQQRTSFAHTCSIHACGVYLFQRREKKKQMKEEVNIHLYQVFAMEIKSISLFSMFLFFSITLEAYTTFRFILRKTQKDLWFPAFCIFSIIITFGIPVYWLSVSVCLCASMQTKVPDLRIVYVYYFHN